MKPEYTISAAHIRHQQVHHAVSSPDRRRLVQPVSSLSGWLAAQMSRATPRGIQQKPIGRNQPPIAQPLEKDLGSPGVRMSALIRALWNQMITRTTVATKAG